MASRIGTEFSQGCTGERWRFLLGRVDEKLKHKPNAERTLVVGWASAIVPGLTSCGADTPEELLQRLLSQVITHLEHQLHASSSPLTPLVRLF